jgi:hypothetical protein
MMQPLSRAWNKLLDLFYMFPPTRGWDWCGAESTITLIDGSKVERGTYVMYRRVKGAWEYRACTPDEYENAVLMNAIR